LACTQANFEHVAIVDLEPFGVYQPPTSAATSQRAAELGLRLLDKPLADFEIECSDGATVSCHRGLLESRWPWYKDEAARGPLGKSSPAESGSEPVAERPSPATLARATKLVLPHPSAVIKIFVRYLAAGYSLTHSASERMSPATTAALLVFASEYGDDRLREACKYELYRVLDEIERRQLRHAGSLPKILEAATLSGMAALQLRSLRMMMVSGAASRVIVMSSRQQLILVTPAGTA
jgi:hypothetical protein